ncbi:MAG: hypothetical protein MJA32_11840 [Proteobacteria bacterium]|nr:hypothetical protein [Pseudomonadota bacterium]
MKPGERIRDQLRRNAVALISLAIAITSLGYNTWRNEASEYNRNQRLISIEVLRNLGDLQQVVFHNAWDMDVTGRGNPRTGWVHVIAIRDLTLLLDGDASSSAAVLLEAWNEGWHDLEGDSEPYKAVIEALERVRADTHALLRELD